MFAVLLLGGTLTYSTVTKENAIQKNCEANEVQDNILENLLKSAETATIKQLRKETKEGKENSYTIRQMQELYEPTFRELEENNAC